MAYIFLGLNVLTKGLLQWVLSVFMLWSLPLVPFSHPCHDCMTDSFIREGPLCSQCCKKCQIQGKLRKRKNMHMKSIKKSMTQCWNIIMDPCQPVNMLSHSVTPVTSVTSCRMLDPKWQCTEHNQNHDSASTHDTITSRIVIELGHLARVNNSLSIYDKNEAMFIIFIHSEQTTCVTPVRKYLSYTYFAPTC